MSQAYLMVAPGADVSSEVSAEVSAEAGSWHGGAQLLRQARAAGPRHLVVDLTRTPQDRIGAVRSLVADFVLQSLGAGPAVWVQISPGPAGHADARAVVRPGLTGLWVARVESAVQLDALDTLLSTLETERELPPRSVAVAPVLTSAIAVLAAPAIARSPRVSRLVLAEARLAAELGVSPGPQELLWPRAQVVLASSAAAIAPPIADLGPTVAGPDAQIDSARALRRLGFGGAVITGETPGSAILLGLAEVFD